ncbi:tetratricopeptide repeat protein [Gammaproteobacteria bacterium]|nr:tetratricopeptide repeat protein [Gammaproteobacteria bacterium]
MKYFVLLCLLGLSTQAFAQLGSLEIHLSEPQWILDANSLPLTQREAGLAPQEENVASVIRPFISNGQYAEAAAYLESADKSTFSPAMFFVLAQLYLNLDDMNKAATAYQSTLAIMPDFLRAHRGLGVVYLREGNLAEAHQHVVRAIELGANDAQIYGQLSYINLQLHNPWSAISGYQQALFLEPDNSQWQQGLLYALVAGGNYEAAQALLEQLLENQPDNPDLWLQKSNIALNRDKTAMALAALEAAIRLGEDNPENVFLAGQLHLQTGSLDRGVELLEQGLSTMPSSYPELIQAIDWLISRDEIVYAERLLAIIERQPDSLDTATQSNLLSQQAKLASAEGDTETATSRLQNAINLNPVNGEALVLLAQIYSEAQNYGNAEVLYTRAETIDAYREQALLGHTQLAVVQQNYSKALELLETASRENPDRSGLRNNVNTLRQILLNQQNSSL